MAIPNRAVPSQIRNASVNTTLCPSFIRNVFLYDWWLIKVKMDAKSGVLGVGGFASREKQGIRAFQSAAIVKRHDTITLETIDGITVTLCGFINRSLTHQNGFPSEVCNHFLFGFPYYWQEYAAQYFGEESTGKDVPSRISSLDEFKVSSGDGANCWSPVSLDDFPVTRIRDLFMSTLGDSEKRHLTEYIFTEMLQKCCSNTFKDNESSVHSNFKSNCLAMAGNPILDETPCDHKKCKVEQKSRSDDGILCTTEMGTKGSSKIVNQSDYGFPSSRKGSTRRNMTRFENLRNKEEQNFSSNPCMRPGSSQKTSESNVCWNQNPRMATVRNDSVISHATMMYEEKTEAKEDKPILRRSSRLKTLNNSISKSKASGSQSQGVLTRKK